MTRKSEFPKRIARRLSLLLMVFSLSACTSMLAPGSKEEIRVYLLEADPPLATSSHLDPNGPAMTLNTPSAAPGFTGSRMIYVQVPYRLDAFAFHRWADAPARMLEPLLRQSMESSGLFSRVSGTSPRMRRNGLRLESEVLRLQQVFSGDGSLVELAVRFTLIDADSGAQRWSRIIVVREPAVENGPYGGVVAANRAVNKLLEELLDELGRQQQVGKGV